MALAEAPALLGRSLYRFYHAGDDEVLALRGVSLELWPGTMTTLSGPSGSGKSTLVNCLAGLDDPDGGVVEIAGERMTRRHEAARARLRAQQVGMLFQGANLVGHLTLRQNLALARACAAGKPAARDDVTSRLELEPLLDRYPGQLSRGEAARAGLALSLANQPAVLLADEPTGELDTATESEVLDLLRAEAGQGTAVLIVTHSPQAAAVADVKLRMRDGVLV
jgi:putative ABC transport system ATP-binding protein